jgi:hypothetical protein
MKLVYVAGPFRSANGWELAQNVRQAEAAAFQVAQLGAVPVCPHAMYHHFDRTLTDTFWLEATQKLLTVCDVLFVVSVIAKNAKPSAGTFAEIEVATKNSIPIAYSLIELEKLVG